MSFNKKSLSEEDIKMKFITPAIEKAGWDIKKQVRAEYTFTDGRVIVRGNLTSRGKKKRADYILFYKPNMPLAIVEAKDNKHSVGVVKIGELFKLIDELNANKEAMVKNISDTRNKVLQLAIQGKLIEQCEEDKPAIGLLMEIKAEKERLIKQKVIKKEKPLPEITDEEEIFDLPVGLEWCRLGDIGIYKKGPFGSAITKSMFVPKSEITIKVYEQKNAIKKDWKLGDYYVSKDYFESNLKGFEVLEGDIIVSCAGTIGETYIMPHGIERGIINQALMKMKIYDSVNINYFLLYFDFILKGTANESSKGSAIKNIPPFDIFKKMLFPMPPMEEQIRIVAKVDEIMGHLDELEKTILSQNII